MDHYQLIRNISLKKTLVFYINSIFKQYFFKQLIVN